ncbi:hypothetical protein DFH09DRAFT_1317620 [Mycena vulgaris]|nr:hypothetical protein DFH09DRAFT_1317620 [Mycena vulgaris]
MAPLARADPTKIISVRVLHCHLSSSPDDNAAATISTARPKPLPRFDDPRHHLAFAPPPPTPPALSSRLLPPLPPRAPARACARDRRRRPLRLALPRPIHPPLLALLLFPAPPPQKPFSGQLYEKG